MSRNHHLLLFYSLLPYWYRVALHQPAPLLTCSYLLSNDYSRGCTASRCIRTLSVGNRIWQLVDGGSDKLCKSTSLPPPPPGYKKWRSGIEFSTKTTVAGCKARCESLSWCRFMAVGSTDEKDRAAGAMWCQLYDTCPTSEVYAGYTQHKSCTGANRRCLCACLKRRYPGHHINQFQHATVVLLSMRRHRGIGKVAMLH